MSKTEKIKVPALLDLGDDLQLVPGTGRAGWGVFSFDTLEEAHAFARRFPQSRMPCWRNPANWGGKVLGA